MVEYSDSGAGSSGKMDRGDRSGGGRSGRRRFPGFDKPGLPPDFEFDFKNAVFLRSFITETGKIMPARMTRLGASHQRALKIAIKRARHMALLPYADSHQK